MRDKGVGSLSYVPSGSLYREFDTSTGCRQSSNQIACSYVNSLPTPGNAGFTISVTTNRRVGWLVIGARMSRFDLTSFGAPN
jgi:hypothetical protein